MGLLGTKEAKTGSPWLLWYRCRCGKFLKLRYVILFKSGSNVHYTDRDHTLVKLNIVSCASGVT